MPPQHPRSTLFPYTTLFRSANALLKSLEEPAANTLLILISHSPSIVMPTIRSRCQIHLLPLPSADQVLSWLSPLVTGTGMSPEQLLSARGGAPVRALALLDRSEERRC